MRVPNYNNLTVNGTMTGAAWNGTRFGVLAFRVAGELSGTGAIHMNQMGYRGGSGGWLDTPRNEHRDATQGESYPGVGVSSASPNGGGGAGRNAVRGAGAGYATVGANGTGTNGGQPYGDPQLSRLWMGSGGGGGDHPCSPCAGPRGGAGGGAVYIYAQAIDYGGSISSKGQNGSCVSANNWSSGGGSGGTIRIQGADIDLSGSITAARGDGCVAGNGSVGRIAIFYSESLSTNTVNPAAYVEQEGQPTPTPTPTLTPEPTLQPGWHDELYEYEGAQPHAVTRVEFGEDDDTYTYDANGNMLQRVEDGVTWTQAYNAENRLSSISDGTDTWTFTYDGDGNRVRQTGPTGEVTLYPGGGIFEVRDALGDAEFIKYYGLGGQRVALSGPDGMQYMLTDHLGSVSAVLDAAGNLLSQQRYTPFGEARFDVTLGTTDFGYTGQRALAGTGLMDYNARFYAPGLGRFMQPDTIVPGGGNPQAYSRYTYVFNNPLNFIDPSGHFPWKPPCIDGLYCGRSYGTSVARANLSPSNLQASHSSRNAGIGASNQASAAVAPDVPIFSTLEFQDVETGTQLKKGADIGQHIATAVSGIGTAIEIGGCLVGAGLVSWGDSFLPFADAGGCLAGFLAGASTGGMITRSLSIFTNILASVGTVAGDLLTGDSSLTVYENRIEVQIGLDAIEHLFMTVAASSEINSLNFNLNLVSSLAALGILERNLAVPLRQPINFVILRP